MNLPSLRSLLYRAPHLVGFLLGVYAIAFTYVSLSQVTHERRLKDLERLLTIALLDAESGQRGYLVTADRTFLAQYSAGLAALAIYEPIYKRAVIDPESKVLRRELSDLLIAKRAEMALTITTQETLGQLAAMSIVRNRIGHEYTERVYDLLHRIRIIERDRVAPFQFWQAPPEVDIHDTYEMPAAALLHAKSTAEKADGRAKWEMSE